MDGDGTGGSGGGRRGRARRSVALAAALGALLFALVLGELVARRALASARARVYRFSEERIWEPIPGARKVFARPRVGAAPLSIPLRFNRLGLRGPDPDPDDRARRVVVFGDSYVEARYVPEEETFCARLEQALGELGSPARVWNAGVTGYGPDQSYLRLRDELPRLEADLVVFVVFAGNDFGDLVRNKLFGLDEGRLVRSVPLYDDALRRSFDLRGGLALRQLFLPRREPSPLLESVEPMDSRRVEAILERALASARDEYEELARGDAHVRHPFRDLYDADLSLEPALPSARAKAALMEAVLGAVAEHVRSRGQRLLFVLVPHILDVCPGTVRVDRERWPDYHPASKTDLLEAAAERLGVPCVNLFPSFAGACEQELYFTVVDDHWNARGQALAADVCAATIRESGLLR